MFKWLHLTDDAPNRPERVSSSANLCFLLKFSDFVCRCRIGSAMYTHVRDLFPLVPIFGPPSPNQRNCQTARAELHLLDLFFRGALGEEDQTAYEVLEGDPPGAAAARRVQPLRDDDGHVLPEHVLRERLGGQELPAAGQSLEGLAHPLVLGIGHWNGGEEFGKWHECTDSPNSRHRNYDLAVNPCVGGRNFTAKMEVTIRVEVLHQRRESNTHARLCRGTFSSGSARRANAGDVTLSIEKRGRKSEFLERIINRKFNCVPIPIPETKHLPTWSSVRI